MKLTEQERDQLASENMNLVYFVVHRYDNYKHLHDELYSAGLVGYAKAILSFDNENGTAFTTYGVHCIDNEIKQYLRMENALKRKSNIPNNVFSYYDIEGGSNELFNMDTEGIESEDDILLKIITEETYNEVVAQIQELPKDGKEVIEGMFGINRIEPLSQSDQAIELKTTQPNICKKRIKYLDLLTKRCLPIAQQYMVR